MKVEVSKAAWKRPYVAPRVTRQQRCTVEGKLVNTSFEIGGVYGLS